VTITPERPVVRSSTFVSQAPLLPWKTDAWMESPGETGKPRKSFEVFGMLGYSSNQPAY
jgi:hypothetical protein